MMQRREFITLLGGAAAAWPRAARAQQQTVPVVGLLYPGAPETSAAYVAGFRKGLSEAGYDEGRNVTIEYRYGGGQYDRLPELAADLVRRRVAVIATPGNMQGSLAAKAATTTIPVVFSGGVDPVQMGLVASFNRPGGNVTGVSTMSVELGPKRLGLVHELLPAAARFAVLINPEYPQTESIVKDMQAAAVAIGRQIDVLSAATIREIDAAFAKAAQMRTNALVVSPDNLFNTRRVQLTTLASRHGVPTIYWLREFVEIGGLISYGASETGNFRQVGIYVGRILKGEKPVDLPVMRPTKFELVINLQTARTLDIEVPPTLLALADEVID